MGAGGGRRGPLQRPDQQSDRTPASQDLGCWSAAAPSRWCWRGRSEEASLVDPPALRFLPHGPGALIWPRIWLCAEALRVALPEWLAGGWRPAGASTLLGSRGGLLLWGPGGTPCLLGVG
ncbi:hypothetical protein NDU88_005792 [Pleurodeles waltl]|uniref:Uncharacterized protein n=1 Tax=Pleurodeles waltl TaxID=8319 RepID=A0AAV7SMM3_PLEWA|nr:hypothetical protein NDU88_005792 [Pleurodeles waltl]